MNIQVQKVYAGLVCYGLVRNTVVATQIPMEKDELYTRRAAVIAFVSMYTPVLLPMMVTNDLSNIERWARKMPTRPEVHFIN